MKILGDEQLREIARDIAETVQRNTTIDWRLWQQTWVTLWRMVKRLLRKNRYSPDKQEHAAL